ncbi:hypothetical protein J4G37_49185, partial [Microvirga sp. 3-52]|nr:hypothetical protein [Microvirga sp. 3-52]
VSKPKLKSKENVKVIRFPWIKRSPVHRIYFELFIANKVTSKYSIDKIVSLQNLIIPRVTVKQEIYIHNAIPLSKTKFDLIKFPKLWFYQNVYKHLMQYSIKKADKIYVQTKWMKREIETFVKDNKKIIIKAPNINNNLITNSHTTIKNK